MSADGQRTKWCRNIAENFNRLSRAHERYRQTTDDRRTADDIGIANMNLEFTFANYWPSRESGLPLLEAAAQIHNAPAYQISAKSRNT